MHEFSLVACLLDIIHDEMTRHNATRLIRARVSFGALNNIVPDSMYFAFEAQTRGTPLQGAILELEKIPLALICPLCGHEITPERILPLDCCPECGAIVCPDAAIGRELSLTSLELE